MTSTNSASLQARRPRLGPAGRLLYTLSQGTRVAWFLAQYRLAAQRASPALKPDEIPPGMPSTGEILGRLFELLRRDRDNIDRGIYAMPHDWVPRLLPALRMSRRFFADLDAVNRRRWQRAAQEVFETQRSAGTPYPRYFVQNFHFQTDGYLSDRSAELYDYQVEVLFHGAADAMRRQALVPLAEFLHGRRIAETRLLDVATGTGRFLTFVKDNYPRLPTIALDLSPHYLQHAQAALARDSRIGFVNAPAEAMPLADASIDVVTCIYLLHELPRKIREAVAREIARVLRPGGRLILMDSLQQGDAPPLDPLLALFPKAYHEPYYADYTRTDLNWLFGEAGLVPVGAELAFFSKLAVFDKRPP